MNLRFGVIPTNGRECVERAVVALLPQVNGLIIVEAGTSVTRRIYPQGVAVLPDPQAPDLNISRWWNLGIDWATQTATAAGATTWDVAIINDDVIVPSTWLCYIADDMRALGCVAGCSGGYGGSPTIHRRAEPVSLYTRLQGFAYVIAGESGLRADEDLKWWYGDDKLGAEAAANGGMVMFPGCNVQHLYPNAQTTMDHQPQIGADRTTFISKMGFIPW